MVLVPHDHDVLLGRGTTINTHPGNQRLRLFVSEKKQVYSQAETKKIKRDIAISIVQQIQSLTPPGRFLIDSSGGKNGADAKCWVAVEQEKAIEKVLHRLREKDRPSGGGGEKNGAKKESTAKKVTHRASRRASCSSMTSISSSHRCLSDESLTASVVASGAQSNITQNRFNGGDAAQNMQQPLAGHGSSSFFQSSNANSCQNLLQMDHVRRCESGSSFIPAVAASSPNGVIINMARREDNQSLQSMQSQFSVNAQQIMMGGNHLGNSHLAAQNLMHNANKGNVQPNNVTNLQSQQNGDHHQIGYDYEEGSADRTNPTQYFSGQHYFKSNDSYAPSNNNNNFHPSSSQQTTQHSQNIQNSINPPYNDRFCDPIRNHLNNEFLPQTFQCNSPDILERHPTSENSKNSFISSHSFTSAQSQYNVRSSFTGAQSQDHFTGSFGSAPLRNGESALFMDATAKACSPHGGAQTISNYPDRTPQFSGQSGGVDVHANQVESKRINSSSSLCKDTMTTSGSQPGSALGMNYTNMKQNMSLSSNYTLNLHAHANLQHANRTEIKRDITTPDTDGIDWKDPFTVNQVSEEKQFHELDCNDKTKLSNLGEDDGELENDLRALFARNFKDLSEKSLLQPFEQISLRQWIEESKRNIKDTVGFGSEFSSSNMSKYVKKALPIALKLADRLASDEEALRKGLESDIPQESISTDCIVIYLCADYQSSKFHDSHEIPMTGHDITQGFDWDLLSEEKELLESDPKPDQNAPMIERLISKVDIVPREGADSTTGSNDVRLFSLGVILFELFSQGNLLHRKDRPHHPNDQSAGNLDFDSAAVEKPSIPGPPKFKKYHRKSITDGAFQSESISKLLILGVPSALCAVIGDLLDCQKGRLRGEDAYKSFSDVREDLQLMLDEPSRFLESTQVGTGNLFMFSNKLYGREKEIENIEQAYSQTSRGACNGVLIVGEAGVGKSAIASSAEELTTHANGYFFRGQFDKNYTTKPLFIIGNVFNQICDAFAENIHTNHDKQILSTLLQNSLGIQADLLHDILPSLSKLMPLKSYETSNHFVDMARSLRFLFFTLLQTLSSHFARSITILLDDVQWADALSLLLISSILHEIAGSKYIFFVICCRDDDIKDEKNSPLAQWLASVSESHLKRIVLGNLDAALCGKFVSDALCLSPRLVRSLSSVLFSKTLGNPFFLRKMLESLQEEGCLHFSLKGTRRRWVWDLDKILELEIADNVVTLLTRKLDKLPSDMQQGLQAASCMGSSVDSSVAEVLSSQLGFNLRVILLQAMQKGYMDQIGSKFRFVHDKVHQAVYEMMPEKQRRQRHMAFGLVLSSEALNNGNDDMLFIAVSQINRGGPGAVSNPLQKPMIASLNMNVGKKAVALSDFASALDYFEHGILFLNQNHWESQYALSNELFGAAAEAACENNDPQLVMTFSDRLLSNAKSLDDKLNAMYIIVKSFRRAMLFQESKKFASNMLELLGEGPPRPMGDPKLISDIRRMHGFISDLSDDSFLNLKRTNGKKQILIMKAYYELLLLFHSIAPNLMFSACLRIVQISLEVGITESSPIAFAHFAVLLLETGDPCQAHRLGSLALRLAQKLNASGQSSMIIAIVQQFIAWTSEPLQSIAESLLFGYNAGMQAGDIDSALLNYNFFIATSFYSGKHLDVVRKISGDFIQELLRQKQKWFVHCNALLHLQAVALVEGPDFDASVCPEHVPSFCEINSIVAQGNRTNLTQHNGVCHLMRAFLFRQYDEMYRAVNTLDNFSKKTFTPLKVNSLFGIFYEGLASLCIARRTNEDSWAVKGRNSLLFMKQLQTSSTWNFENKALLLEAELLYFQGNHDQASELYVKSIKSAKDHKFIHEEGIAHELVGYFYQDRERETDALQSFNQAIRCYRAWGAKAMSKRLEDHIQSSFSPSLPLPAPTQVKAFIKDSLAADALAIQVANVGMSPSPPQGLPKRPLNSD